MYGHVINVPTYFNVKLPAIGGHLSNADAGSHLLVVRTCYNGQCKQMPHFRWSFEPKIARGELLYYYDAFIIGSITIAYTIMAMHDIMFSMNIAGGDDYSRARCITFGAAYTSLRRAATCHVGLRTLLPTSYTTRMT